MIRVIESPAMILVRSTIFVLILVLGLMATPVIYHYSKGNLTIEALPPEAKADAVMVFTGSAERVLKGYEVYKQGMAEKLMITGFDYPKDSKGPRVRKISKKVKKDGVTIDLGARNTIENAEDGAEWAMKNHVRSILLVTSEGHMPRAYFELRRLLPPDVKVYTDAVPGKIQSKGLDRFIGKDSAPAILVRCDISADRHAHDVPLCTRR